MLSNRVLAPSSLMLHPQCLVSGPLLERPLLLELDNSSHVAQELPAFTGISSGKDSGNSMAKPYTHKSARGKERSALQKKESKWKLYPIPLGIWLGKDRATRMHPFLTFSWEPWTLSERKAFTLKLLPKSHRRK